MSDAPSMTPFLARRGHLARVGSTNDVVRDWLAAGTPEPTLKNPTSDNVVGLTLITSSPLLPLRFSV